MEMVEEEEQSFKSLIDHLTSTFQHDKTDYLLIAEFLSWTQNPRTWRVPLQKSHEY